ncbi:polysaccharide biosynthesis/export family protein [Roseibacillus persicicus]|uniref:polysaccharide biosynthesis/export family protein n=1 Tax=Roseibacillus persicicus TaxID=454148 RepID=UPI00280D63F4|nr:polysaccharide biosynthesis/export family protein [Roseibacillus persicicus]MDQ8192097.1 polysaccharide biosynthesis/export family protein [Roseibacillus persicicus]
MNGFLRFLLFLFVVRSGFCVEIERGERVEISVLGVPVKEKVKINDVYRIDDEGFVQMPGIEPLKLEGISYAAAAKKIEAAYIAKGVCQKPVFLVISPKFSSELHQYIEVNGDVKQAGVISYFRSMTLEQALAKAGEITKSWPPCEIRVTREKRQYVFKPYLSIALGKERLYPGDVVEVRLIDCWSWFHAEGCLRKGTVKLESFRSK